MNVIQSPIFGGYRKNVIFWFTKTQFFCNYFGSFAIRDILIFCNWENILNILFEKNHILKNFSTKNNYLIWFIYKTVKNTDKRYFCAKYPRQLVLFSSLWFHFPHFRLYHYAFRFLAKAVKLSSRLVFWDFGISPILATSWSSDKSIITHSWVMTVQ